MRIPHALIHLNHLILLNFLFLFGCSGQSTIKTEYVEGVVKVDGVPIEEATVVFTPVNKSQGTPAIGFTDAKGQYKLTANGGAESQGAPEAGTTPGEYYVGLTKSLPEPYVSVADGGKDTPSNRAPILTHEIPQRFNYPPKSGIKVIVEPGKNNIPLEVSTK